MKRGMKNHVVFKFQFLNKMISEHKFFFGNYISKFTRMKTATVTVEWFQQNWYFFFITNEQLP